MAKNVKNYWYQNYWYFGIFAVVIVAAVAVFLLWGKGSSAGQAIASQVCVDPDYTYTPNSKENPGSYNKASSLTQTAVRGYYYDYRAGTKTFTSMADVCNSVLTLKEMTCLNKTNIGSVPITCPLGCVDGACAVACKSNADCPPPASIYSCNFVNNSVYLSTNSTSGYYCDKPGTMDSKCLNYVAMIDHVCPNGCNGNVCAG